MADGAGEERRPDRGSAADARGAEGAVRQAKREEVVMEGGRPRGRGTAIALLLGIATPALGASPSSAPNAAVTISHEPLLGWADAYRVSNGHVTTSVVPAAGGRVLEFSLDGRQALWVNPALQGKLFPVPKRPTSWENWRNYGGYKLWPAPQSLWPQRVGGAPDPFLDGGAASVEVLSPRGLRLTGAPSLDMGLLFVRELEMDPQTGVLTVQQRLRNIGPRPVDWSIWDVTQIPALIKKGSPAGAAFAPRRVFHPAGRGSRRSRSLAARLRRRAGGGDAPLVL
jgi:Domain of unknown function (DUF4380)